MNFYSIAVFTMLSASKLILWNFFNSSFWLSFTSITLNAKKSFHPFYLVKSSRNKISKQFHPWEFQIWLFKHENSVKVDHRECLSFASNVCIQSRLLDFLFKNDTFNFFILFDTNTYYKLGNTFKRIKNFITETF